MRRLNSGAWALLVTSGALLLAAGGLLVDRTTPRPLTGDVPEVPVVVSARHDARATSFQVALKIEARKGMSLVAPSSGFVTSLPVQRSGVVHDGDVIAEINDQPVVAMAAAAPLYRDLRIHDHGPDVARLQSWLVRRGLYAGPTDGAFGTGTARAVARFNSGHHLSAAGTMALRSLVWIGTTDLPLVKVDVGVGDRVVEGATQLAVGRAIPVAIVVSEPGGVPSQADRATLSSGSARVGYVVGSGRVSAPVDVKAVSEQLGPSGEGVGNVRTVAEKQVLVVPPSAVVTDSQGVTCVFESVAGPPIRVTPSGGGLAGVDLPVDSGVDRVLVNPAQVRRSLQCT
jgi:peptidoglycan hydrolase-like protein with peptidoglycan-binding domain